MYNQDCIEDAKKYFLEGEKLYKELDAESKSAEPELVEQRNMLAKALGIS